MAPTPFSAWPGSTSRLATTCSTRSMWPRITSHSADMQKTPRAASWRHALIDRAFGRAPAAPFEPRTDYRGQYTPEQGSAHLKAELILELDPMTLGSENRPDEVTTFVLRSEERRGGEGGRYTG